MRIEEIRLFLVDLPFKGVFSFSRFKDVKRGRVVVEIVGERGDIHGFGEAVPVDFVTGETPESVLKHIEEVTAQTDFPWDLDEAGRLWDFVDEAPEGKEHNSTLCCLESALLDALTKFKNCCVVDVLPREFRVEEIRYGGILPLGKKERIKDLARFIRKMDLRDLRVKMDKDLALNRFMMDTVESIIGKTDFLRIDPNGVWDRHAAMEHLFMVKKYGVRVVEEPMPREHPAFEEVAERFRGEGALLMACESAPTLGEVEKILEEGFYGVVNVKLCRSGGFRRALRMIDRIREAGIRYQIGCTLGESGILSAGGRALGLVSGDAAAYDGSYDAFILKENTTNEDVGFGPGGAAGPLPGPGLGVEVDASRLEILGGGAKNKIIIKRP